MSIGNADMEGSSVTRVVFHDGGIGLTARLRSSGGDRDRDIGNGCLDVLTKVRPQRYETEP